MTTEIKIGDKSNIQTKNYEDFKAKRDEEKKARQKRIEERLLILRMKRFAATEDKVVGKENVLKCKAVLAKGINRHEQKIPRPLLNNAAKNSQIAEKKASQDIGQHTKLSQTTTILKRKCPANSGLNINLTKGSKSTNVDKLQGRPKLSHVNKLNSKPDIESRKKQLELWRAQKLEKTKETNKEKSLVHKKASTLSVLPSKKPLVKKPDVVANRECTGTIKKSATDRVVSSNSKQIPQNKRISLSSRHFAEKCSRPNGTKASVVKGIKVVTKQPRRGGNSYMLDLKGRVSVIRPSDAMNVSKALMKERLNKWLEEKGKSPSTCRRHMSCYGLHSSTPIGGRVKLEVRTAIKPVPKNREILKKENVEPFTESKVRVRRMRDEVQDCNIFRSSRVFFKCREVMNQKSGFDKGDITLIDTPMRKMFIVTPVRRSTRKSCLPALLKEHDILVETVDELSADVKQMSIFKPNKCLVDSGIVTGEPAKKHLKFDDC